MVCCPGTCCTATGTRSSGYRTRGGFPNGHAFGSVARGEDTEGSDLDLLAYADNTVSLFDLNGVHNELMKALGTRVDGVLLTSRFPERIRAAILADAKPL